VAIVVPGRGPIGKTRLVAELVRRGAAYYSDVFAVLDGDGRVHPYRERPGPDSGGEGDDDGGGPRDLRLVREGEPADPLPVGLIVAGRYLPDGGGPLTIVRGAHAVLPLVDSAVLGREAGEPGARVRAVAARVAPEAVALRGPRPEAEGVAAQLLDLVDDALVSHALGAAGPRPARPLAADLARAAALRLRSETDRPLSPPRRLAAARHVRVTDFLSAAEHQRLLDYVLAHEDDFHESGVIGPEGQHELDLEFRRSRTLWGGRLEEVWELFERRLRGILPGVRQELDIPWFPVGRIERQLTAHGSGGFFAPHVDTGDAAVAGRRISCIYYFHRTPQRYTGGELKLYDTWETPTGSTGAGTYTTLAPLDNSMVFFPSDAFHEVCPVQLETDAFGDSRFTVTIWVWRAERPAPVRDAESPP
jgi:Rps23 Pro-64 3,4-dihydroxylase Tpa1-like proline 4-hydroxylase